MSLDKRLRDHRDAHRSAFEAPVSLPVGEGRVIGWHDGGYLIQEGSCRRIKQASTNGVIATGSVMATRGRVDGQGNRKTQAQDNVLLLAPPRRPGILMWLDDGLLTPSVAFHSGYPTYGDYDSVNAAVFAKMVEYFLTGKPKNIYTLRRGLGQDVRIIGSGLNGGIAQIALESLGVTVHQVDSISESRGLFFLPLLDPFTARLTEDEFRYLRLIAAKYGLLIEGRGSGEMVDTDPGEFFPALKDYLDHLLRGLNIRDEVTTKYTFAPTVEAYAYFQHTLPGAVFSESMLIRGNTYRYFLGLRESEKLAIADGTNHVVFALFKPES